MDVTPAALKYFLVLAKELHFGKAAEVLGISVPSLSTQITKLERNLGHPLFRRTTRQAWLTPQGEQLVPVAEDAVRAWGDLATWAEHGAESVRPRVRVGIAASGLGERTTALLTRAIDEVPGLQVEIRRMPLMHSAASLLDHTIDVLLSPGLPGHEHPQVQTVATVPDPMILLISKDHPLAGREAVELAETSHETYIWVGDDTAEEHLNRWLINPRPDGTQLRWGPRAHDFEGVLDLVAAGMGVNITGKSATQRYQWSELAYVPITDMPPGHLNVQVLRNTANPIVVQFVHIAQEIVRS